MEGSLQGGALCPQHRGKGSRWEVTGGATACIPALVLWSRGAQQGRQKGG